MEILLSNTKDVLKETLDDPQRHYIAKAGYFAIALGFIEYPSGTSVTNYLADETYFSVNFFNVEYVRNSGNYTINRHPIEMAHCNDANFPLKNDKLYNRKRMDRYLCPVSSDYFLQGDFNSEVFYDIEIYVTKCSNITQNNTIWKDEEEIDRVINSGYIDIALLNTFFDFDDYEDPIKTYLSANEILLLHTDMTNQFKGFVQHNTVLKSDNLFYGGAFK